MIDQLSHPSFFSRLLKISIVINGFVSYEYLNPAHLIP